MTRHPSLTAVLASAAVLGLAGPAVIATAQTERPAQISPEPLDIEALGLRFHPPAGALIVTEKVNNQIAVSLSDSQDPTARTWTMRITPVSSTTRHDAQAQVGSYFGRLKASRPDFRILRNEPIAYGLGGQIGLLEQEAAAGKSIAGWLVLNTGDPTDQKGGTSFIVISLTARADQIDRLQPIFDASFDTIEIRSIAELALSRRARLERGRTFLAGLDQARLESLAGTERWLRIYQPADPTTGAAERDLGYSMLKIRSADRSSLDSDEPSGDDEPGLLVHVQARVVLDAEEDMFYDSSAEYWLDWDGQEESWVVKATQRRKQEALQSSAETGIRTEATTGEPVPSITVIAQSDRQRTREPHRWRVPDVYLSQALSWVLPQLLPTKGGEPIDMSYYYYFPNPKPRLTLRRDTWALLSDGSGRWLLTTSYGAEEAPVTAVHEPDGTLVRRMRPNGSVTEPTTLKELERHWRKQGLNMKRVGR